MWFWKERDGQPFEDEDATEYSSAYLKTRIEQAKEAAEKPTIEIAVQKAVRDAREAVKAELLTLIDKQVKAHQEWVMAHVRDINKRLDNRLAENNHTSKQVQLILLNDGNEVVTVPEHLELRKIPKAR
jgi:hypothetical protein